MTLPELEAAFSKIDLTKFDGIKIGPGEIKNAQKFVDSHIRVLKGNSGNRRYKPYYDRLMKLYNLINKTK